MLNNFRNLQALLHSQGSRWLLFRIAYALRKQTGSLRRQMAQYGWADRPLRTWLKSEIPSTPEGYALWRKENAPAFFFKAISVPANIPWDAQTPVAEADRILSGELKYFSHSYYRTGFPPDWHTDPSTGRTLDARKHWSDLPDDGVGDIKFVWEASRFGMVFPLVRTYASTRDEKYAEAFWHLLDSWADANPPNTGPNWMDGQEAALRLLAWMFGYYQFLNSPAFTPDRMARFTVLVAAHAERIYKNIDFAISTHSNHTISEAFGLWLVGLLFPELNSSEKYLAFGRNLLEREAAAQIFPDGTYAMYSLNYHRFVLHLYLCAMRLAELHQSPISSLIGERVSASLDYLSQLIDLRTGKMPVYGSNDGALVLPLNNCDFTDYRPLLQLGYYITKKQHLFDRGPWDEDVFWLCGADSLARSETAGVMATSLSSFPQGGTYLLRGADSHAIIRCTDHRARPSHADQLHVDLWIHGHNIACDAGTYLYSGEGIWRNGLAHTDVHNTITVDHLDQMDMLTRFTWTHWSRGKVLHQDEMTWQGEQDGYKRLSDRVSHRRTVLSLGDDRWLVVDHLTAKNQHHYSLHWLLSDFPFETQSDQILLVVDLTKHKVQTGILEGKANFSIVRADPSSRRGWRSQYYGDKEPAISLLMETDRSHALFWSYFGMENDNVKVLGKTLKIETGNGNREIDLGELTNRSGPASVTRHDQLVSSLKLLPPI